jgi:hypothetical protein
MRSAGFAALVLNTIPKSLISMRKVGFFEGQATDSGLPLRLACLIALMFLSGCGPSEQKKLELAEKNRVECLDKLCPGDVEPPHDFGSEQALKLNGGWYIGPQVYFSSADNVGGFYWPSRHPLFKGGDYSQASQKFYDKAIEIFISRPKFGGATSNFQQLMIEGKQGHVLEKRVLREGLEVWKTKSGAFEETWFVATQLQLPTGEPPVITCRGDDPANSRCSGGFLWNLELAVGLRFRATHGPDWPEVYLEINRVLQQLRKV